MTAGIEPGESTDALPAGYWPAAAVRALLDETLITETAPLPADLSPAERATVGALVAAGRILDDVFQDQLHHQALSSRNALRALHETLGGPARTRDLLELQEQWQGPIATSLDNERIAFLPVDPEEPGRNVYPSGATRQAIESFLADHPGERAAVLHPYTVVRSTSTSPPAFHAVPYAVTWADQLGAAAAQLNRAADAIQNEDRSFAAFLRLRAGDLIANDYERGDAAWIRGRFGRLDAVIGPYESYNDDLFGVKGFFGLRVLVRDETRSASLREALVHLQAIEDALPIDRHEIVRTDIPVDIFDAVADFGDQRFGTGVSEILPNDPELLRKYGRRIVLVHNFIAAPNEFARLRRRWLAGVAPAHAGDLTAAGILEGNVWHEIGHYLGPIVQVDGRSIKDVLEDTGDVLEELKADLLSVFATARLRDAGVFSARLDRENQAGLVSECLRSVKPNRTQAHASGRLILTNGFLDHGVIVPVEGRLAVHYGVLDDAIVAMLRELLEIQSRGSRDTARAYIERHSAWDERHESIAATVGAAEGQHLQRFRNAALD